jgi:hypothetical protein
MTPKKTLSSFRRSLVNRLMAAQRDIRNAKETVRRKNYAAEVNQMELLSALKLLDEYTKRAEGEFE